jgi:hypothetical protein
MSASRSGLGNDWHRCQCGKVGFARRKTAKRRAKAAAKGETVHLYRCPMAGVETWHSTSRPASVHAAWRDTDSNSR